MNENTAPKQELNRLWNLATQEEKYFLQALLNAKKAPSKASAMPRAEKLSYRDVFMTMVEKGEYTARQIATNIRRIWQEDELKVGLVRQYLDGMRHGRAQKDVPGIEIACSKEEANKGVLFYGAPLEELPQVLQDRIKHVEDKWGDVIFGDAPLASEEGESDNPQADTAPANDTNSEEAQEDNHNEETQEDTNNEETSEVETETPETETAPEASPEV